MPGLERDGDNRGAEVRSIADRSAGGGESVIAVAERLGHENAALVLPTYGHLVPGREDRILRAVDEAWCAITVPLEQLAER